jgi:hypothetical protein
MASHRQSTASRFRPIAPGEEGEPSRLAFQRAVDQRTGCDDMRMLMALMALMVLMVLTALTALMVLMVHWRFFERASRFTLTLGALRLDLSRFAGEVVRDWRPSPVGFPHEGGFPLWARKCPLGPPTTALARTISMPRSSTRSIAAGTLRPANGVRSARDSWVALAISVERVGSTMTISASAPTAIQPLVGNKPNNRAGRSQHHATICCRVQSPCAARASMTGSSV